MMACKTHDGAAKDFDVVFCFVCAEWQQAAVRQYAQRCMEAKRQLTVCVIGANSGGVRVQTRILRGESWQQYLQGS